MATTPASQAMPYIQQIPQAVGQYYNPYIQTGLGANQNLYNQSNMLTNNPGQVYNNIASGYQETPYAKAQLAETQQAMNNSAAAGGFVGSPYNQVQSGRAAQAIVSKDQQQYINSIFQLYHMGLIGDEDLDRLGFNASSQMGNTVGNTLNTEAGLAFANQSEKNAYARNRMNNILGLAGAGTSFLLHPLKFENPKYGWQGGNSYTGGAQKSGGASSLGGAAAAAAMSA